MNCQKDPEIRLSAADYLGEIGPPGKAAVPALQELAAKDPDEKVRLNAMSALRRILAKGE